MRDFTENESNMNELGTMMPLSEGINSYGESGRCLVARVKASLIDFLKSQKLRQFICRFSMVRACDWHVSTRLCLLSFGRICVCSAPVVHSAQTRGLKVYAWMVL